MKRSIWFASALAAVAIACGTPANEEAATAGPKLDAASRQADWQWLEATKKALDRKREELASLADQQAAGAAVDGQISGIRAEIAKIGDEFGRRLVDYINQDPPLPDEPLRPEQLKAIRLKSSEDILIAREHIELGGDYRRAIDIFASSLLIDPENADLKAALRDAQAKRFMTQERFVEIKKGMSEAQVIKTLGRPLARNMRDYPEKKVSAWFYPKDDTGEAAGVFFTDKRVVYSTDWNAVKRTEGTAGQ